MHGTPPAAMLGVAKGDVEQVAGDGMTGLYRAKPGSQLPNRKLGPYVAVEAYSWGSLTAGAKGILGWLIRALWLVLLPFALVNLAYWARPELDFRRSDGAPATGSRTERHPDRRRRSRPARASSAMVRVAGLLLTVLFILGVCTISVDLVAWQCYRGGTSGCPALPGLLDFLTRDPWRAGPHRIALGTAPALLVLGVLWFLTFRSIAKCEDVEDPTRAPAKDLGDDAPLLRHPWLWNGQVRTRRLLWLHLATAVCFLTLYTGIPVLVDGTARVWRLAIVDAAAAAIGVVALVMATRTQRDDLEYDAPPSRDPAQKPRPKAEATRQREDGGNRQANEGQVRPACVAFGLAAVVLAAQLVLMFAGTFQMDESGSYVGTNVWFIAIIVALVVLYLGVFLTGRVRRLSVVVVCMGVAAAAFVAASWYLYDDVSRRLGGSTDLPQWPVIGIGVLVVGGIAMVTWHLLHGRGTGGRAGARHVAWRGAGASLFVAAAAWIALLFTTSLVTVTADYLNGPDRSVADLGTSYVEDRVGYRLDQIPPSDLHTAIVGKAYESDGAVTLKDAVVNVDADGQVFVRSGTIRLDDLQARARQLGAPETELVSLGSRQVLNATLLVADGPVRLEDSCVRTTVDDAELLDAEHAGCVPGGNPFFVSEGTLPTGDDPIRVAYDLGTGELQEPRDTARTADAASPDPDGTPGVDAAADTETVDIDYDEAQLVWLQVDTPPQTPLVIPQVLVWTPIGQVGWLLVAGLVAGVCLLRLRRPSNAKAMRDRLGKDGIAPRDEPGCLSARWRALAVHRAEAWLGALGPVTGLAALMIIVGAETGRAPWELLGWLRHVATAALWFAVGSAVLLVWFASKLRTSEKARRGAGILWDLTTFWPRAAHPFAPPCYAERVVPELMLRTRWGLDQHPRNLVVLSGHSQGAVLVAAAASRLRDTGLARVRVITYGCQIRAWYGRIFPAVFGPEAVGYQRTTPPRFRDLGPEIPSDTGAAEPADAALSVGSLRARLEDGADAEPRWVNLYRTSDPLGFRVYADRDSARDLWVREIPDEDRMDPGPRILTHGEYQHTDAYVAQLGRWYPRRAGATDVSPAVVDVAGFPPS